jgi:hypothetical protein
MKEGSLELKERKKGERKQRIREKYSLSLD